MKNRLDAVVKYRAREEERAGKTLAEASDTVRRAHAEVEAAKQKLARGEFSRGSAADWEMRDVGKVRDRDDLRKAEEQAGLAEKKRELARSAHLTAHRKTEVVRRVSDARVLAAKQEEEKQEQRDTDEFVMLRHPSKP